MKFLHTADWHIGKKINGFDLLEEQYHAFQKIVEIAKEESVDGIIIAGDLYDSAIPSVAAVKAFDEMLMTLNIEEEFPIYAISGNHDGANRLNFGNSWLAKNELYLHTKLSEAFTPIETEDTQIFLLPFFDPIDARIYYGDKDSEDLRSINEAMARIIEDMEKLFDPSKKQILVTHFHVIGQKNQEYELTSETTSTVGGLRAVSGQLFENFDYVALGHLHLWQASPDERIRYSGSPIKFNTKEAKNKKGVYIVDLDDKEEPTRFIEIPPHKDLVVLKGTYEELISPEFYNNQPEKGTAFFSIKLTNRPTEKNVRQILNGIYGDILELQYHLEAVEGNWSVDALKERTVMNETDLIESFYKETMTEEGLTKRQAKWVEQTFTEIRKGEEA